uniref:Uncharacterized protein n=1 Tax=Anopheles christyi TaxID=43041 RepID=A0A182JT13_9DIPT
MTFYRALNWKHASNYCPKKQTMTTVVAQSADLEKVEAEETIANLAETAPYVKLVTNISAEQDRRNEPTSGGEKVLLCVKNDTSTVVSSEPVLHTRVLREQNTVKTATLPKPAATSTGSRPVSVTASIFTSLPSGGSASGSEKARAFNKPTVCGATQQQQPSAAASLQSVTAKLFVSLPPTTSAGIGGGACGAGSKPQHATEKIFAPRTEDMNKGFLMFSEEEPGLTIKSFYDYGSLFSVSVPLVLTTSDH